jgi:N-acetylglutamate synthase-like GNAT family acetyltransferase
VDRPRLEIARPDDAAGILAVRDVAIRGSAAAVYGIDVAADWASRRESDTAATLAELIGSGSELVIVARVAGRIVGFGAIAPATGELRALYVAPEQGRRGVASRILATLEAHARRLGMTELHLNASLNAEALYRRHGYAALGRGEHPLPSGRTMTCVRMRKVI